MAEEIKKVEADGVVLRPPKDTTKRSKKTGKPGKVRTSSEILEGRQAGEVGRFLESALKAWDFEPVDSTDVEAVEERCLWYFRRCVDDDIKPTVQGLSNALGVNRNTLSRWASGQSRADTHQEVARKAYNILAELWEAYMSENKINPVSGIFLGKNFYGMKDTTEQRITHQVSVVEEGNVDDVMKLYTKKDKKLPEKGTE